MKFCRFSILSFTIISALFDLNAQGNEHCITPIGKSGQCIPLRDCGTLLEQVLLAESSPQVKNYLRHSRCGGPDSDPNVCCPLTGYKPRKTYHQISTGKPKIFELNPNIDFEARPILPQDCGRVQLSQRLVGGDIAEIDEFPWMALIEYNTLSESHLLGCGGFLINNRYVLTAAHCVNPQTLPFDFKISGVRLGEYNTSSNVDCVGGICSDDPLTFGIEEIFVHELYDHNSKQTPHDIALIRLSRNVVFTDFIQPICLPKNGDLSYNLTVVGWGKTENGEPSEVKRKVDLTLTEREECLEIFRKRGRDLIESQICAGGDGRRKDSCPGDSGGPLMSLQFCDSRKIFWQAVGIVSFGTQGMKSGVSYCGTGKPGIYTKIFSYVPWILNKIRK